MLTLRMAQGIKKAINKVSAKEYVMEGFLEPGLVSYQDVDGGVCRLDKETIDKMLPSFVGCPVTIDHVEESKDEILNGTDTAVKEKKRGSVTKAWWNAETGKYDCSFTVEGQDAAEAVLNGYSGSCAYNVTETGPGGELHAMKYNETILGGEFEHLALVTNPRYEDCRIKLNGKVRMNSKAGTITLENAQETEEYKAMFAKEKKDHPTFTDDQIKQIVLDHVKEKNKSMDGDRFYDSKMNSTSYKGKEIFKEMLEGSPIWMIKGRNDDIFMSLQDAKDWIDGAKKNTITLKNAANNPKGLMCPRCGTKNIDCTPGGECFCEASGCHQDFYESEALTQKDIAAGKMPLKNAKPSIGDSVTFFHPIDNKDKTGVVMEISGSDIYVKTVDGRTQITKAKDISAVHNAKVTLKSV